MGRWDGLIVLGNAGEVIGEVSAHDHDSWVDGRVEDCCVFGQDSVGLRQECEYVTQRHVNFPTGVSITERERSTLYPPTHYKQPTITSPFHQPIPHSPRSQYFYQHTTSTLDD